MRHHRALLFRQQSQSLWHHIIKHFCTQTATHHQQTQAACTPCKTFSRCWHGHDIGSNRIAYQAIGIGEHFWKRIQYTFCITCQNLI